MSEGVVTETGVRARTRRAILDAAIEKLTKQPSATLADIAAAADVGRTTVHRYFPERSDLIDAISLDALDKISRSTERARIDDGPVPVALARLCQEYFEHADVFQLLFTMPDLMTRPEWKEESEDDRVLLGLIERGHREGSVDPAMTKEWVQQLLWSLLYTAWEMVREKTPKHEALTLCIRSLEKVITVG
ncbi:TetR family transcriptional regulator [Amycolatopsis coloradensis]|uniref:TetR family transcriptional regulator n=1 Tax=Amycolatopsis coloradensis TaxID=76021 RepID=A0A1R0KDK2_9PSEU|nr:TetR/AcrR family transcriptional regulator [Amycolatopsis coloradensis]OLZ43042.1 TetR family transcriptional regulator [Amycolatopsis coloradensis]